ncbi:5'/3'-nucleotidase SurE [Spirochaeta cellobiosiphila]|uniref:5'/3'-nucleotidase SurE n=1 Tax=Spirochaeta cellobiosiphila TaxID=504483 RepID=UPI0003F4B2B4|nr:5'/3'-nucleotidase SurE [Spirochaeta cellobiosiphila]
MNIILTNDDGYFAPGIQALYKALKDKCNVTILAPDRERSATSHWISIREPMVIKEQDKNIYSCSGTPADCTTLAVKGPLDLNPDLIISGINNGPNLGTDIIYSGTAAAARQAALMSLPAVAVSMASLRGPYNYEAAAQFIAANTDIFVRKADPDHFLNINIPNLDKEYDVQITTPARRYYNDTIHTYTAPDKGVYCFVQGALHDVVPEANSDWAAVQQGMISISSIYIHPLNHDNNVYQKVEFTKP